MELNNNSTELDRKNDELIRRQDAIDVVQKWFDRIELCGDICIDGLIMLPSAEPEIIRCKDCRHNGSFDTDCPIKWSKTDSDYCSFAER